MPSTATGRRGRATATRGRAVGRPTADRRDPDARPGQDASRRGHRWRPRGHQPAHPAVPRPCRARPGPRHLRGDLGSDPRGDRGRDQGPDRRCRRRRRRGPDLDRMTGLDVGRAGRSRGRGAAAAARAARRRDFRLVWPARASRCSATSSTSSPWRGSCSADRLGPRPRHDPRRGGHPARRLDAPRGGPRPTGSRHATWLSARTSCARS